jgi:hypothetical protein
VCKMRLNEIETEVAAHRAAVAALLRSHLPYGRIGQVAQAVGISREWLERILSDTPISYGRSIGRLEPLEQALAERLANHLGLDANERGQLLEHADLSHKSSAEVDTAIEEAISHHELDVLLPVLLTFHASANCESNPAVASNLYMRSHNIAQQLMKSLPRRDYPLEFAQVCLVLNDLEAVLNRNSIGIYYARLAQDWAASGGTKESKLLGKDADELRGNALIAEAVSLRNLGLDGKARVILSLPVFTEMDNPWSGEAALHLLKCTAFAHRTSLRQVDELADNYLQVIEKLGSKTDPATTSLAFSEAKLRAYLACAPTKARLKKAEAELEQCLSRTDSNESEESRVFKYISQTSALRSVIFLNTYSHLLKVRGDSIQAEKVQIQAESRANKAGLAHQLARISAGSLHGC